jgi:hypothetical protein
MSAPGPQAQLEARSTGEPWRCSALRYSVPQGERPSHHLWPVPVLEDPSAEAQRPLSEGRRVPDRAQVSMEELVKAPGPA